MNFGPLVNNVFNKCKSSLRHTESCVAGTVFLGTVFEADKWSPYEEINPKCKVLDTATVEDIDRIFFNLCKKDEYNEVLNFYSEILGLNYQTWGDKENPDIIIFDTGNGLIEIFTNKDDDAECGIICHLALVTDDIDKTVADVKSAGYEVFVEPKDITVPFNAKIAFCFGPLGEQVEFFEQK